MSSGPEAQSNLLKQWPLEPTGLGNTRFSSMDLHQEPLLMDAPPRGAEAGAKV